MSPGSSGTGGGDGAGWELLLPGLLRGINKENNPEEEAATSTRPPLQYWAVITSNKYTAGLQGALWAGGNCPSQPLPLVTAGCPPTPCHGQLCFPSF